MNSRFGQGGQGYSYSGQDFNDIFGDIFEIYSVVVHQDHVKDAEEI